MADKIKTVRFGDANMKLNVTTQKDRKAFYGTNEPNTWQK
ncbi:MAG: hypothetical protein CM15mV97_500 [Caudoviricetes sp.]|nr:MAG: hypothetical protein CM15mV97_500 [Caudoviricetes sp.]